MSRSYLLLVSLLTLTSFESDAHPGASRCTSKWCDAAEKKDESVILKAIENNNREICQCFCESPDDEYKKLLHKTANSEAVAFADLMISEPFQCDVDIRDANGNTPLHEAAEYCNTPMAYVFLSAGDDPNSLNYAEPDTLNNDNETPLCVAAIQNDPNCAGIVKHLVEFGADICKRCPDSSDPNGKLPYDVTVNKTVRDTIDQLGGQFKDNGGICEE